MISYVPRFLLAVIAGGGGPVLDPVLTLMQAPISFSIPVALLAIGAIGTTLLASYLAIGQFITDALKNLKGSCTTRERKWWSVVVVSVPTILASAGPRLYMPLLAFAGAFPTTLLYCLMPPLADLALQRRSKRENAASEKGPISVCPPNLLPGGNALRVFLVFTATALVGISAADFTSRLWPPLLAWSRRLLST